LVWRQVTETLEASSIVVVDEAIEEGVSIGVRDKEPMSDAAFGLPADGFDDATVEAFDEAVGLRPIGSGEAMVDATFGADAVEGMASGRSIGWLALHVDGEAIGELAAIVGEDSVNGMREVVEEAREELGCGLCVPLGMDLQIDIAGGPIDGDEGVTLASFQGRQMLEIDMDEANGGLLEDADRRLSGFGPLVEPMTDQAAMDGAARQIGIDATPHHLGDVVERQLQLHSQFAEEGLFEGRETGRQSLRDVRAISDRRAATPTADRRLAHPQLGRQFSDRLLAALDVSPDFRCGRGISVQVQLHDARRSLIYEMPRSTPIPSKQSPGTKHESGGPYS